MTWRTSAPLSDNRAVLYIRTSPEEQANPDSLGAQEAKLRNYGKLRRLDVVDLLYDIGVSAREPLSSREAGQQLLELIRRKRVSAVVVFSLNRLFRSMMEFLQTTEEWDRKGVALHIVNIAGQSLNTASATGRFMVTMMANVAQLEHDLSSEGLEPPRWEGSAHPREGHRTERQAGEQTADEYSADEYWRTQSEDIVSGPQKTRGRGRPPGTGKFVDGQRFTVRLSQDLATRLMDHARARSDSQSNCSVRGMVSVIVREALEHYLNGCDREVREQPATKATTTKRTRTPAKAAKG